MTTRKLYTPELVSKLNPRYAMVGRKRLPAHIKKVLINVHVAPAQRDFVARLGGEQGLAVGVRKAIAIAMQVKQAQAAERAADTPDDCQTARNEFD
jgi:hypothetical protein